MKEIEKYFRGKEQNVIGKLRKMIFFSLRDIFEGNFLGKLRNIFCGRLKHIFEED